MDTETLRQNLTTRFVRGMDILSEFIATDEDEEDWGDVGDTTLGGYISAGF